jgi:Tfp pilus assembly protein PilO
MKELPKTFAKIQLPPINKQNQVSMIEMFLLVVIITLFYFFVISPKKAELVSLNTKAEALRAEQGKIQTQKKDLENFISNMKASPDLITKLDEALPLNGKVMTLHLIMDKLVSEAGVSADSISFSGSSESPLAGNRDLILNPYGTKRSLKKILGSLSVKGTFEQIQIFLKKLEESGRLFDLSDMQMNIDAMGLVHLNSTLSTYYFAP